MIRAFYILTTNGLPIYYYTDQKHTKGNEVEEATLFSGMISAIYGFLSEMNIGEVKVFETNKNQIFLNIYLDYVYVIIADKGENVTEKDMESLLNKFYNKIKFNYDNKGPITLSNEDEELIDYLVKINLDEWEIERKSSNVAKKLKRDLW